VHIVIGKSEGKNVSLDVKALLRTHLLIWASTGGGKSFLIRRMVEQLFGKTPILIIDREGEFQTLREKFGFVLVGQNGETPADPRSAKIVAERLLEMRASAVCDLFELSHEARHEWVRNFYLALINAPKRLWGPTTVWLDEAHSFAPEKGQGESIAYGAVTDFNGVARKRGFGSIFATQRLAKLSKNATAEMYNQAAGPTAQQSDRDRAAYEMGISGKAAVTEFSDALRTLDPGNFFFQGRAISMDKVLVKVGPIQTSHGTETTGKAAAKAPPTPEEVKKMLPKLADLPKVAEERARSEADLRKEIRELKQQLRAQPAMTTKVVTAHKPIKASAAEIRHILQAELDPWRKFAQDVRRRLVDSMELINKFGSMSLDFANKAGDYLKEYGPIPNYPVLHPDFKALKTKVIAHGTLPVLRHDENPVAHRTETQPHPAQLNRARAAPGAGERSTWNGDLPQGEKEILIAIARYQEGVERNQLTVLTSYKRSTRDAYIARLKPKGLIELRGDRILATEAGIAALGSDYTPQPATGEELQRYWMSELPEGEKKILQLLIAAGGEPVDREKLDEATGFARSSRDAYLSRLGAKRLVHAIGRGQVQASQSLFT